MKKLPVKKIIKLFRYGCMLAITGAVILFSTDCYVKAKAADSILSEDELIHSEEKADAILVLGAQVKANGQPCLMLEERLNTGIQLFKDGAADRIIMSGDHGSDDYDEVNAMKSYAIDHGVVVTQEYHLYRALYDAMAFGLDAQGVPCDTAVYEGDAYRKSREVLARMKDVGFTLIKPEPAFLGDTISLNGSGDVTNDKN